MTEHKQAGSERPGGEEIRAAVVAAFDASDPASADAARMDTGSGQQPGPAEIPEPDARADAADAEAGPQEPVQQNDAHDANTAVAESAKPAALTAPENWKTSDKEIFNTLPEPAQKFLLERHQAMDADHTRKTQAIADFRREYEPVEQLFAPHRTLMRERGITAGEVVAYWAEIERRLGEGDGVRVIKGIAEGYGIDPAQIAAAFGLAAPAKPHDQQTVAPGSGLRPDVEAALAEIPRIKERLAAQDRTRVQAARAAEHAARAQRTTDIENFKRATDADGRLLHPYAGEVEDDMVQLALIAQARGQAVPPLAELYDRAVRANPSTYQALRIAEAQSAQQRQQVEARAKAAAAKKAGSSITGGPGVGQPPPARSPARSLREEILAQLEEG